MPISSWNATLALRVSCLQRFIPPALIAARVLLAPLLFLDASDGSATSWFLIGFVLATVSDIFDGVIARRIGTVTARLREFDGRADVWLYGWVLGATWMAHRAWIMASWRLLALMVGLQILAWAVDFTKYRRFSNYHTYTARIWGATLFFLIVALYLTGDGGALLYAAVVAGTACTLEEIAITSILPHWTHDVPSVVHAIRMRPAAHNR